MERTTAILHLMPQLQRSEAGVPKVRPTGRMRALGRISAPPCGLITCLNYITFDEENLAVVYIYFPNVLIFALQLAN